MENDAAILLQGALGPLRAAERVLLRAGIHGEVVRPPKGGSGG